MADRGLSAQLNLSAPASAPSAASGHALMERLGRGEVNALDELLRRYWSPLVAYVSTLAQDWAEAEDIAQETFFELWRRWSEWQPDPSPDVSFESTPLTSIAIVRRFGMRVEIQDSALGQRRVTSWSTNRSAPRARLVTA